MSSDQSSSSSDASGIPSSSDTTSGWFKGTDAAKDARDYNNNNNRRGGRPGGRGRGGHGGGRGDRGAARTSDPNNTEGGNGNSSTAPFVRREKRSAAYEARLNRNQDWTPRDRSARGNGGEDRERDPNAPLGEINRPPRERGEDEGKNRKLKMCLLLAYRGTGYKGLQINPGTRTIEGDLENAIFKAGFLTEDNHNDLPKVRWSRAARTDKGVHAAGNVVSLKMTVPDDALMPPEKQAEFDAREAEVRAEIRKLAQQVKDAQPEDFKQELAAYEAADVILPLPSSSNTENAPAMTDSTAESTETAPATAESATRTAPGTVVYIDTIPVRIKVQTPLVRTAVTTVARLKEELSWKHSVLIDAEYASETMCARINAFLPAQVQVLRVDRVSSTFDSKLCATSRTYEYIIPSFAFVPVAQYPPGLHAAMLAAVPPLSETFAAADESARAAAASATSGVVAAAVTAVADSDEIPVVDAREAAAAEAAARAAASAAGPQLALSAATHQIMKLMEKMDAAGASDGGDGEKETVDAFSESAAATARRGGDDLSGYKTDEEAAAGVAAAAAAAEQEEQGEVQSLAEMVRASLAEIGIPACPPELLEYRMSPAERARVDGILKTFIGSQNHHNLTKGRHPRDPSCRRFIDSFVTTGFFYMNGVEFVHMVVHGQSFMLHQIRKMIGYSVALARGTLAPRATEALFTEERIRVPMAPALGLLLDRVHFRTYDLKTTEINSRAVKNKKFHEVRPTMEEQYEATLKQRTEFKEKYVYSELCARELALQSTWMWLHWANDINYWGQPQEDEQHVPRHDRRDMSASRVFKKHSEAAEKLTRVGDTGAEAGAAEAGNAGAGSGSGSGMQYVTVVAGTTATLPSYVTQDADAIAASEAAAATDPTARKIVL